MPATIAHTHPILDRTCWYCGADFETRDPDQGLCPPCDRLRAADMREDTAVPWFADIDLDDVPAEDDFRQALKFTITRGLR